MKHYEKSHVSFGRRSGGSARRRARRSNSAQKQMAVAATKVHAAALSAILMFSSPPLEFTKSKMSLWQPRKCGWRGGVAKKIRRQQRSFCRTHFRCRHSDNLTFVNLSARTDNSKVADNAAVCAFACATATCFSSKFWASER